MTNKPKPPTQGLSKRAPLVDPVPMSEAEESALLRRSEEFIFAQISQGSPALRQHVPPSPWTFAWNFGLGFAAMAICLWMGQRWWLPPTVKSVAWETTQVQYTPQIQPHDRGQTTYQFQALAKQEAFVTSPKQWKLQAAPRSQFSIKQQTARHTVLRLQRGGLRISVNPKRKQQFEVHHRKASVFVRGTVFSVNAYTQSMWVELQRGHVQVVYRKQILDLRKGRGVRIDFHKHRISASYAIPPSASLSPLQQFAWLLQRTPSRALEFAMDLLSDPQHSPLARKQILLSMANGLKQKSMWRAVETLQMAVYQKAFSPQSAANALYEAAVACYKQKHRYRRCIGTFQLLLQKYPNHIHAEQAKWYLEQSKKALQQANTGNIPR